MARPSRTSQMPNLRESIRDVAWRQITESGASSLSLRRIARELGITAPAIYNYFSDRDALVTALIVDAYASFGDCQHEARNAYPGSGWEVDCLRAIGIAYRRWALDHPHRYLLIFGNPVPGYEPPMQEILPVMMRSLGALLATIGELHALGRLEVEGVPLPLLEPAHRFFALMETADEPMLAVYAVAMVIWSRVHGFVSLEITGQLPPFAEKGEALYGFELDSICRQFVRSQDR
ncbi:MAG: TetR/AcrR family transcriptional regulator [Chlorobium sp.]|uniref:TetR/AcrR family transcriptional regulator n=1 Tax=Chlorobium sp. TaxID=1095 RepID=UPI0025BECB75|nr:TetR/AcrR family transcriptional regulator [Chlorobium sp.]MCF8216629.1 TetR/AcrR family transcriptional regulator [Chlorobium sp.]MCF8271499.1 TetR/AcrR family transcriptional regulator [Chlorobium sp.]MCF8287871.1 TetR/AcrR family transcriptional regulator [Chlorobium sp.]MCF8291440.1 TetR/AcrR family transcriptional regulator [Chlorobium sp.]MCF8385535.1 TetR/AcrR family transcriptional regulator [Chlorobium sp.]